MPYFTATDRHGKALISVEATCFRPIQFKVVARKDCSEVDVKVEGDLGVQVRSVCA